MASAAVATATSTSSASSPASIPVNEGKTSKSSLNEITNGTTGVTQKAEASYEGEQSVGNNQPQHNKQQPDEGTDAAAVASTVPPGDSETTSAAPPQQPETSPLPTDLRKIILQVARTGTCSSLPWDYDGGLKDGSSDRSSSSVSQQHIPMNGAFSSRQKPFSTHRRSGYYTANGIPTQPPPRKKQRNGLHKSTRRRLDNKAGRKRPLFLIRTNHSNPAVNKQNVPAPGSVGSGRTSGSEPDDSTQYECDSEGTSATTNSEVSVERLRKSHQQIANESNMSGSRHAGSIATGKVDECGPLADYKTLREAFRIALGLVLDHFYQKRGGYKLSPAEKRRNENSSTTASAKNDISSSEKQEPVVIPNQSAEYIFHQRRQKLLGIVLPDKASSRLKSTPSEGPPFTIQRVAEVLVSPDRYYTQTHKLCNCLEKLLLVKSSTGAFGGSTGGDTSQSRREEREIAALADEKGRQESELRLRSLRRRTSSPTDDVMSPMEESNRTTEQSKEGNSTQESAKPSSPEKKSNTYDNNGHAMQNSAGNSDSDSRELLEAAARASLRTKFDHVGIDPHSSPDRDLRSIAENRGMTNSPPPPSLAMSAAPSNIALQGHSGFVRQHLPEQNAEHHSIACVPSPILFPPTAGDATIHPSTNMHMLQLHHAVTLAGALSRPASSPLDLMGIDDGGTNSSGRAVHGNLGEGADLEADHGRSSASNSDVDSESDDLSLDDSASDRSDGSDSGPATHYEPFTAARAMALNRMQQQQRLQSRVLTSLGSVHASEGGGFRPPADSEYQSGDSIDSMRAEDSGGSDSSSSDLAD